MKTFAEGYVALASFFGPIALMSYAGYGLLPAFLVGGLSAILASFALSKR